MHRENLVLYYTWETGKIWWVLYLDEYNTQGKSGAFYTWMSVIYRENLVSAIPWWVYISLSVIPG